MPFNKSHAEISSTDEDGNLTKRFSANARQEERHIASARQSVIIDFIRPATGVVDTTELDCLSAEITELKAANMFDNIPNEDISTAINELIACLGVREEMAFPELAVLLPENDTEGCVQEIARQLGLPIRINLSYVSKNFSPDNKNRFSSHALALTDWTGRGIEGITAQVSMPQHLPMFGTSGLQDYPIQVRVSAHCHAHPDAFVAIMVHELSHVLLASLRSTRKDSELHTDLVPIILGFRDVVRRGRKTIKSTTIGDTTTTQTTTFGYLTDSQFEFACNYVTGLLRHHSNDKKRLLKVVEQIQRKLEKAARSLAAFRDYFKHLDIHPPERMKMVHAERVVRLHGHDYSFDWESRITAAKKSMEIAEAFARGLNHYLANSVEQLKIHIRALETASKEVDHITEVITKDERILRKYVGFTYRLRRAVAWFFKQ